jgi:apolipoprotein N-acyltransferase
MKLTRPAPLALSSFFLFLCGFSSAAAFNMFFQDLYGLTGYIEYLKHHWVELSPWVGAIAFAVNTLTAVWMYYEIKKYVAWSAAAASIITTNEIARKMRMKEE